MGNSHGFKSPAFIVGFGRSGTTVLAAALNRHPKICVTPETGFFVHVSNYRGGINNFAKEWPGSLYTICALMASTKCWDPMKTADDLSREFPIKFPGLHKLFRAFGENIVGYSGKALWIEKTPLHLLYIELIRQHFPDSPIVHIVRDGRDVALSRSKVGFLSDIEKDFLFSIRAWAREVPSTNSKLRHDTKSITIRFEDFIQTPERIACKICDFLSIDFTESILLPDGTEQSLIEKSTAHKQNISLPFDVSAIYRWKEESSKEQYLIADMFARDALVALDYEVRADNSSIEPCKVWAEKALTKTSSWYFLADCGKAAFLSRRRLEVEKVFQLAELTENIGHSRIIIFAGIDGILDGLPTSLFGKSATAFRVWNTFGKLKKTGSRIIWFADISESQKSWALANLFFLLFAIKSDVLIEKEEQHGVGTKIPFSTIFSKKIVSPTDNNYFNRLLPEKDDTKNDDHNL